MGDDGKKAKVKTEAQRRREEAKEAPKRDKEPKHEHRESGQGEEVYK